MDTIKKCRKIEEIRLGDPHAYEKLLLGQANKFDGHLRSCPDCSFAIKEARAIELGLGIALNSDRLPSAVVDRNVNKIMNEYFAENNDLVPDSFWGRLVAQIVEAFCRPSWAIGFSVTVAAALIVFFSGVIGNGPENGGEKNALIVDFGTIETTNHVLSKISIKNLNGVVKISGAGTTRDLSQVKPTGIAASILEGDLVETAKGASCELAMAGGGYLLRQSSAVKINKNGVEIVKGAAAFKFNKNSFSPSNPFAIETGMATVFILGTELEVSTGTCEKISLIQGKIAVSLKNSKIPISVRMTAGQMISIDKNGARLLEGNVPAMEFTPENISGRALNKVSTIQPRKINVTSEVKTQNKQITTIPENVTGVRSPESAISGPPKNNDPQLFSFSGTLEDELTGEISVVPESDLNIDYSNGFPSEAKWLEYLFNNRDKYLKYRGKGLSRIMFHKMYLKAKQEFEAKTKGLE